VNPAGDAEAELGKVAGTLLRAADATNDAGLRDLLREGVATAKKQFVLAHFGVDTSPAFALLEKTRTLALEHLAS
jgi:hypothetical protein